MSLEMTSQIALSNQTDMNDPKEEAERSKEIEKYLKVEKKKFVLEQQEPKLLILGTSDSGKTTLLKQLKIIHGGGIPKAELEKAKYDIYKAINDTARAILLQMSLSKIEIDQQFIYLLPKLGSDLSVSDGGSILDELELSNNLPICKSLWDIKKYKTSFESLPDNAIPPTNVFYMDNIERISHPDYVPTNEGIILLMYRCPKVENCNAASL